MLPAQLKRLAIVGHSSDSTSMAEIASPLSDLMAAQYPCQPRVHSKARGQLTIIKGQHCISQYG